LLKEGRGRGGLSPLRHIDLGGRDLRTENLVKYVY
jgi:hypothetical protein